jgi:hypothetical protein
MDDGRPHLVGGPTSGNLGEFSISGSLAQSVIALALTAVGSLENRADEIRGQTWPFGPRRKNLLDGLMRATMLLAFVVSFLWLWLSWPWYLAVGALAMVTCAAQLAITGKTIENWVRLRPVLAVVTGGAAAALWLLYPPSR